MGDVGPPPYRARNGHLLLVDVAITNNTSKSVEAISPWTLTSGGTTYEASSACDIGLRGKGVSGVVEVRAGKQLTGTVCFDVPESVASGSLAFSPMLGGGVAARTRL